MKKVVFTIFVFALFFSATTFAQSWDFGKYFPDSTFKVNTGGHGIATSPDGKIWFQAYGATDSIKNAQGTMDKIRVVYAFNPDGTPASFSPIKTVTVNSVTDTLYNSNRGMRADNNGNILFSSFNILYRVNYQTGEGMNKLINPATGDGATLTAPAVDAQGNIFTRSVFGGFPVYAWGPDFSATGQALDTASGFSRTIEVSADGNTIYQAAYTNNAVLVYHRADEFSAYEIQDTVMKGFQCESISWDPKTGYLWASSGSQAGGLPNQYPGVTTNYTFPTWYAWDTSTWTIKDSINWKLWTPTDDARPRGIAFSPTGDTAYVTCFGAGTYPAIESFYRKATAVKDAQKSVVTNYSLAQNYPNPFNPTTQISYNLPKEGFVTLRVYNMLGQEVATLVNGNINSGEHTVTFNAANLSSGTYVYQLNANGVMLSQKMILLK